MVITAETEKGEPMSNLTRDDVREMIEEIIKEQKEQSQIDTTGEANADQHTQSVESVLE